MFRRLHSFLWWRHLTSFHSFNIGMRTDQTRKPWLLFCVAHSNSILATHLHENWRQWQWFTTDNAGDLHQIWQRRRSEKGGWCCYGLIGQRGSENGKFLHCYHCILWWGEIFRGRSSYCVVETFEVMVVGTEHRNGMLCCITKEKLVSDFFHILLDDDEKYFSTKKCRNSMFSTMTWLLWRADRDRKIVQRSCLSVS